MNQEKKVLVVEDEENIAFLIRDILELYDIDSLLATRADEALNLLSDNSCQMAIIDFSLPDMNGLELYRAISDSYPEHDLQFVFMSGHNPDANFNRFLRDTHSVFVQKPFQLQEFRSVVEDLL